LCKQLILFRDQSDFPPQGHETSALVVSNALLMLALHPEVQQKAVQEIKDIFGRYTQPAALPRHGREGDDEAFPSVTSQREKGNR
jgi:Cytochrome P450